MRFSSAVPTNVLGTDLQCCCRNPLTGFFRDVYCRTGPDDTGLHTVCLRVRSHRRESSFAASMSSYHSVRLIRSATILAAFVLGLAAISFAHAQSDEHSARYRTRIYQGRLADVPLQPFSLEPATETR